MAADYSNVWADEYIKENRESRMRVTQQTEEALRNQLDSVKAKLEQADAALLAYARTSNLMFTGEDHSNVTEEKLRRTQEALREAEKERITKQAEHELIAAATKESLPAVLENPAVLEEQAKLEQLRSQLAELKTYMAPGHARIIRLEAQVAELKQRCESSGRVSQAALAMTLRPLGARRTFYRRVMTRRLLSIRRSSEDHSLQHPQMRFRQKPGAIRISSAESKGSRSLQGDARRQCAVGEPAQAPLKPYRPRVLTNALMGLMAGLFLAIAFVALRERVDYNIRVPGESPACLRVPELGAVPSAESGETLLSVLMPSGVIRSAGASLPAVAAPAGELSPVADSFRAILASLLFSPAPPCLLIGLVITSAGPGEGKSTVISNLGLPMAETGQRVLLIDGDLRCPRLHEISALEIGRASSIF